jgi:uroporphyrinogen decarboxylase
MAAGNTDFSSQVAVCQAIGLCAVGQAVYERFGSHKEATGRSYHWVPHIRDWDGLSQLKFPDLDLDRRRAELGEASAAIGDTGLAFFSAGMFCVATSMNDMGFENFCTKLHDDPRLVRRVMEGYADYNGRLIEFYSSRPEVDFLWIADDIAYHSSTFFSPRTFRQHILPIWRDMVTCIRKPWIFHSDGNLEMILDDLLSLGMAGLHPIEPGAMNIFDLKQRVGDRVALVGNVDMGLMATGMPSDVERATTELLEGLRAGGGYLLSSGNSISADVQPENVAAMGRALKRAQ